MIENSGYGDRCSGCGKPTQYVSLSFGVPMCSLECEDYASMAYTFGGDKDGEDD